MPGQKPVGFHLKPVKGVSLDRDETAMPEDMAKYIKNLCITVTGNPSTSATPSEGDNADIFTKLQSNYLYIGNMVVPAGINFAIGYKENKENNRGYVLVWNSLNNHFIYRIKGDGSGCDIIYQHPDLNFQLDPKYFIPHTRIAVENVCVTGNDGVTINATYIIFCDAHGEMRFIPEDDAIKTNSFNFNTWPYFISLDPQWQDGYITRLGVPPPNRCIGITPIPNTVTGRSNKLLDKTWQFRIKYTDRWGRPSEYGGGIATYYPPSSSGSGCQANATGVPRCLTLKIPAGYPTVETIEIAYRNCNGNASDLTTPTDWSRYEIFNKYRDEPGKQWYERLPNNILDHLTYNASDNTFDYIFCGDKECTAIPVAQTNRLMNPLSKTASGLFKLSNSIAISDLEEDYPPLDPELLNKVSYVTNLPSADTCRPRTRSVRIVAVIHSDRLHQNQPVWKMHAADTQLVWGGISLFNTLIQFEPDTLTLYKQGFPKDVQGFPGYFLGTNIVGYSKQYILKSGTFAADDYDTNVRDTANDIIAGNIRVQVWDFPNVPEGEQIFRVAWHLLENIQSNNYEKTSTFVKGKVTASNYDPIHTNTLVESKEIIIPCKGAFDNYVNLNSFLVISDLTSPGENSKNKAICGYVKDFYLNPIELLFIDVRFSVDRAITDHNGFYYYTTPNATFVQHIRFKIKDKCVDLSPAEEASFTDAELKQYDLITTKRQSDCKSNQVVIKGKITDCSGIGLTGIIIALTRGQYALTDSNGFFTIIAHDTGRPEDNPNRSDDRLVIIQNGVCTISRCNDICDVCLDEIPVFFPPCTLLCDVERLLSVPVQTYSLGLTINQNGLKSGGTYRMGLTVEDWMGRISYVQNTPKNIVHIPTNQVTLIAALSGVGFVIDPLAVFPAYVKRLSFWRTRNLNGSPLQWVIDKAEYVDSTGNINPSRPEKIKLYITGLNNYNLLYNLKTNVNYSLLQGDRIEFINKYDGSFFADGINVLVTDSKDGTYLLIDYDSRLADLKGGERIELQRPYDCEQKEFYFECSCWINVIDGKPAQLTGNLPTYDTYLFRRKIAYKNSTGITTSNIFPFPFEHHSPSDLWGDHCDDKGRINSVNPYERQICAKTKVRVSNAFVADKILNGLGRFEKEDYMIFDEQEWGRITGIITSMTELLVICEHANFITGYKQDRIRIDKSGNVTGDNNLFGRPERRPGNNLGCQIEDVNTIQVNDGIVCYVDSSNNALVQHNFDSAFDASERAECKGWISSVVKFIVSYNNNPASLDRKFMHGCLDPKRNDYILTIFSLPKFVRSKPLPVSSYVNTRREISFQDNETIVYNPIEKSLKGGYSFTPEYYGVLFSDIHDGQLISFKNGLPYFHYKANELTTDQKGIFYGVQTLPVMELVLAVEPNAVKRFMWQEVMCREQLFFADRIVTEAYQVSRILKSQFERRENFSCGDFKCDLNTFRDPNVPVLLNVNKVIFEGDMLYGKWIKIRYVGDPDRAVYYCELNGMNVFVISSGMSGTSK